MTIYLRLHRLRRHRLRRERAARTALRTALVLGYAGWILVSSVGASPAI